MFFARGGDTEFYCPLSTLASRVPFMPSHTICALLIISRRRHPKIACKLVGWLVEIEFRNDPGLGLLIFSLGRWICRLIRQ